MDRAITFIKGSRCTASANSIPPIFRPHRIIRQIINILSHPYLSADGYSFIYMVVS